MLVTITKVLSSVGELLGVESIEIAESDPWVPTDVPEATIREDYQHIKPINVEGTLTIFDGPSVTKLAAACAQRGIIATLDMYGKNENAEDWIIRLVNVRVRSKKLPKISRSLEKPEPFVLTFWADSYSEIKGTEL